MFYENIYPPGYFETVFLDIKIAGIGIRLKCVLYITYK